MLKLFLNAAIYTIIIFVGLPVMIFFGFIIILIVPSSITAPQTEQEEISEVIDIDVSSGIVEYHYDSHGGFHGDGLEFTTLSFVDDSILEQIKINENWKELPLTDNLRKAVYGNSNDPDDLSALINEGNSSHEFFPQITNGYYYFYDKHKQSVNPYDDSDLFNRYSWNFVIIIYDLDTNMLHYAEFDT